MKISNKHKYVLSISFSLKSFKTFFYPGETNSIKQSVRRTSLLPLQEKVCATWMHI